MSPRNASRARMEAIMSQRPFRFLHAADLRLDQPVSGVPDAPDELVDLLIDCPLKAAECVFDAAISQRASFVVLAGNVIDAQWAAPREWLFLAEQFERLAHHNIAVYWAGGSTDSVSHWHDFVRWPANVRYFPPGRVERYRFEIAGGAVCEIIGAGHDEAGPPKAYDFSPQMSGVFSMAVANASWNSSGLHEIGVNYWALGGAHSRSTPLEAGSIAHFPGTPQGRTTRETGPHGCTIVSVDEHSRIQLTPVDCDVVRWHWPRVSVGEAISSAALTGVLCRRAEQLLIEQPNLAHLVSWKLECGRALRTAIRRGELKSNLLESLRTQLGRGSPPCWTVDIEAELPEDIPRAWHDEDSIRGDFLRELRSLAIDADISIEGICGNVDGVRNIATPAELQQIRSHAAWLGADLLSPQEATS
jgi:DNA repair exonuclease SbcCD nuclease subunit